jgi:hypothetical protein
VGGAASVGKTTVLKRAALELSRQGRSVIWLRHYPYQDGPKVLKDLFAKVSASRHANDIVVVVDDPIGLGTIRLEEIRALLSQLGKPVVLVTGVRTTDLATADTDLEDDAGYALTEITIPDTFDAKEWASLPKHLHKLNIYATEAEAQIEVDKAASKSATDVLSALYYLLPETRSRISDSLRGEYTRLGDRASLRNLIIGGYRQGAELLKRTYDYVAVASKYHAPVPMEVLVSALGQDYESWRSMTQQEGLAFGLFYQEESLDAESVTYRTRNHVVSDIIVTYINGGVGVRGGEMARLKELLQACNGTAPAYRDFCHRILLPPKERGEEKPPLYRLDHAERIALFDVAITALPVEDPVLLHHKGIWEGRSGDTASARQTFDRAIKAKPYPYSTRIEAPEHIHTSAAANEVRAIKNDQVDRDEGKRNALHHLERALSTYFFNASAIHTKARLVAELADLTQNPGQPDADWFDMIGWALSDIDRSMLQLKTEFAGPKERKDIEMLDEARDEILSRCLRLGDDLKAAEDVWNRFRSQEGFTIVGRRLFGAAQRAGKDAGKLFKKAFDHCHECLTKVLDAGAEPAGSLIEVQLHIYFQWQVRRRVMSGGTDEINWKMIGGFASRLTRSVRTEGDPFYRYLGALSQAHLGDWAKANSTFEALRRGQAPPWLLHEPRDYLMNAKGGMREVQGIVTRAGSERFLKVDELGQDFRIARSGAWSLDGDIAHAYVRFSYAGPLAVQEE